MKRVAIVTVVVVGIGDFDLRIASGTVGWVLGLVAASFALIAVLIALQTAYLHGRISVYHERTFGE